MNCIWWIWKIEKVNFRGLFNNINQPFTTAANKMTQLQRYYFKKRILSELLNLDDVKQPPSLYHEKQKQKINTYLEDERKCQKSTQDRILVELKEPISKGFISILTASSLDNLHSVCIRLLSSCLRMWRYQQQSQFVVANRKRESDIAPHLSLLPLSNERSYPSAFRYLLSLNKSDISS